MTRRFAVRLLRTFKHRRPLVLALEGGLGAGKTTFIRGLARSLGVLGRIQSPTFVLVKWYRIPRRRKRALPYRYFVHADAYRIESSAEGRRLGIHSAIQDPDAIAVVEWADRIKKLIPQNAIWIRFRHRTPTSRTISYETPRPH